MLPRAWVNLSTSRGKYLVGDHECGIKANTEASDDVVSLLDPGCLSLIGLETSDVFTTSRFSNCAQVLLNLLGGHTDPIVLNDQLAFHLIGAKVHLHCRTPTRGSTRGPQEAKSFDCITRVGN